MLKKKTFSLFEVIMVVIVTGILSALSTGIIFYNRNNVDYVDLSHNNQIQDFLEVYASVITGYYEEIDENELMNSAIEGMFNYLGDDYSTYLSEKNADNLEDSLSGEYEGIGVQISEGNIIQAVFKNSPAEKAGIKEKDVIVKIDNHDVTKKSIIEVATLIKKSKKNNAILTVKRNEEILDIKVSLKTIDIPTVDYRIEEKNNKKIGYIYIESFSATTAKQVETALKEMEKKKINALIVDVRNNSGGYLSSAEKIANLFLDKGKTIYSLKSKNGMTTVKDESDTKRKYKVVVLTNKSSASAAEILAAALKESYGATLVGDITYGKGKVQQKMPLSNGSMVKYTSSLWLTPKGNNIDGTGLKPDVKIAPDESMVPKSEDETVFKEEYNGYIEHLNQIGEQQYNKALEILSN